MTTNIRNYIKQRKLDKKLKDQQRGYEWAVKSINDEKISDDLTKLNLMKATVLLAPDFNSFDKGAIFAIDTVIDRLES